MLVLCLCCGMVVSQHVVDTRQMLYVKTMSMHKTVSFDQTL